MQKRGAFDQYVGKTVNIIYLDRHQRLSQRKIRVLSAEPHCMTAYCYTRKAPRLFRNENILAIMPVQHYVI